MEMSELDLEYFIFLGINLKTLWLCFHSIVIS